MSAFSTTRLPCCCCCCFSLLTTTIQDKEYRIVAGLHNTCRHHLHATLANPTINTKLYATGPPSSYPVSALCLLHLWTQQPRPHTSRPPPPLPHLSQHNNGPTNIHGRQNSHRRQRHQNKSTAPLLHRRSQTIPSLQTWHRRFEGDQEISTQYRFVDFETAFC